MTAGPRHPFSSLGVPCIDKRPVNLLSRIRSKILGPTVSPTPLSGVSNSTERPDGDMAVSAGLREGRSENEFRVVGVLGDAIVV